MSNTKEVRVWDPLIRFFHWALLGSFIVTYLSGDEFMALHEWAGYSIAALLVVRLIWGVVGTRYSRFADFVRSPSEIKQYLQDIMSFRARRYLGHNPAGGAMVIALLFSLSLAVLTGMAAYGSTEALGPFAGLFSGLGEEGADVLEELHEIFANAVLFLIGAHVLGVLFASVQHQENLVESMWTGFKKEKV